MLTTVSLPFSLRFGAGLALVFAGAVAYAQTLHAPAARISDEAVHADHRTYRGMQDRLRAINERGRPLRDYHLSKAQCWLDVSFHEYTRNDRSPFPQAALDEAAKLATLLEGARDTAPLAGPWDTPLVNDAARLRPDLWARARAVRGYAGFACAQQRTACAEVELVHAGNEERQQGWRHAKPYVQIAEDAIGEAEQAAAACAPAPASTPAPVPVAPAATAVSIEANVVFDFDRHEADRMRPEGRASLESLAKRIASRDIVVGTIRLIGHADRLNGTGQGDYNARLSQRRVDTVKAYLVARGVDAARITTEHAGDSRQIVDCRAQGLSGARLEECLAPNRRVEVRVEGTRAPKAP